MSLVIRFSGKIAGKVTIKKRYLNFKERGPLLILLKSALLFAFLERSYALEISTSRCFVQEIYIFKM